MSMSNSNKISTLQLKSFRSKRFSFNEEETQTDFKKMANKIFDRNFEKISGHKTSQVFLPLEPNSNILERAEEFNVKNINFLTMDNEKSIFAKKRNSCAPMGGSHLEVAKL